MKFDYKTIGLFLLLLLTSTVVGLYKVQLIGWFHYVISMEYFKFITGTCLICIQIAYKLKFNELKIDFNNYNGFKVSAENITSLFQNPATILCSISLIDKWLADTLKPQNKQFFSDTDSTFIPYVASYLFLIGLIDVINLTRKSFLEIQNVTTSNNITTP